ncbi:MAG: PhnD/SsuA/transferrin family substrate-binding protein [Spirochaetes bacterium]|nr:PhnD/SsuA/transferrin family substrate-binding protein [Spirochaetota bacterium]
MNSKKFLALITVIVCAVFFFPFHSKGYCAEKINFAVIFLGGPDTGEEGEKIISQFMTSLTKLTSMKKDSLQGKYFNNISDAKSYIKQNKNSYIMGSLGFYLANKKSMNLSPLAVVKIGGDDKEQYYLIVKKGAYKSLKQLKGKVLAGNILYEDTKFINKVIFDNKIDVTKHFQLKPSNRPLSAVRKLTSGQFDAVLLNNMQYNSLKNLDVFNKIEVIFQSSKMPALGLMMTNTKTNNAAKNKIVNAVTRMCNQADTKDACKNFGIDGFDKLEAETLKNEITKYEGNK